MKRLLLILLLALCPSLIIILLTNKKVMAGVRTLEAKILLNRIKKYEIIIISEANANNFDPDLIRAVIWQESSGEKDTTVYEGSPDWYNNKSLYSYGLMGLTYPAAKDMFYPGPEEDLLQPEINIRYGTKYLKYQYSRYKDLDKALCAYNAGHWTGNLTYTNQVWKKMAAIQDAK